MDMMASAMHTHKRLLLALTRAWLLGVEPIGHVLWLRRTIWPFDNAVGLRQSIRHSKILGGTRSLGLAIHPVTLTSLNTRGREERFSFWVWNSENGISLCRRPGGVTKVTPQPTDGDEW